MKSVKFVFLKTMFLLFFSFSTMYLSFSQTHSVQYMKPDAGNNIQFIGIENDILVFELRFAELPVRGCTLRILDESGNAIFEDVITGTSVTKRYKIAREGMRKISFRALGKKFSFNQSFTIKTEEKVLVITE